MQPPLPPRMLDVREPAAVVAPAPALAPGEATALAQLGAWRTQLKAEETVRAARAAVPAPPPPLRVAPARVRGRLWWRVVAGPMRPQEARALCLKLSAAATPCWVRALGAE